ncbi:MAG: hypothetical protein U0491_03130 [Candidatus Saccharimonadales bacterium]
MKSQKGFSVLPVILLAVVIGVVGVVGWKVLSAQKTTTSSKPTSQQAATVPKESSDKLQTKNDVEKVQNSLDSASVDSDLDTAGIDDDLNSLL